MREMQQRLLSLRQSLEKACQDLDEQIAALGTDPPSIRPLKPAARPQPTQAHREAAAEFTRRLFEADPAPLTPTPAPVPASVPTRVLAPDEPQQQEVVAEEAAARVIEATASGELDPELEKATLEELNSALSAAFAQISQNRLW